ncbi:amidohydrolase [Bacillus timonensis]|uniref:amidohydrolase n=1 Tax=Bacillus timonensis TaxID=1033734 RepID=UPI00028A0165|nr:amidohydrolase [Bacillus timonensis]
MKTTETFNMEVNAYQSAVQLEDYVIGIRRNLHLHPEIGLQEIRTMNVVTEELEKMNINYEIVKNGGIIGVIEGGQAGKTIVLRADLDALPMEEEETNLKQKKNVVSMTPTAAHTCGHDGHTAMLLGAAKILSENKDKLKGKVILAFEQGEEMGGGIFNLMERLIEIGADGVWGIHLKSDIPSGKISVDPGPRMASAMPINVIIKGTGGHGSRPDLVNSPVDCFVDFYNSVKQMRLDTLDPFKPITFSLGTVKAGTVGNIIPETIQFSGSFRYLHYDQGLSAEKEFKRLLEKTCALHECEYEYVGKNKAGNLFVYNQEECADIAKEAVKKSIGGEALYEYPAWMASESFSFFQKYFPGVFAFVGIQNEEKGTGAEHHNPHFDIDEDVLKLGVAATVQYTLDFLNSEKEINYTPEKRSMQEVMKELGFK